MDKSDLIKLKKLFQINTAPVMLSGMRRGKKIGGFSFGKAMVGSKNIYSAYREETLNQTYKVVLLMDCSGSRRDSDAPDGEDVLHIIHQIIDIFYNLKTVLSEDNIKIYLYNRAIGEAKEILGSKIFSYKNARDLLMDFGSQLRLDAQKKLYEWMNTMYRSPTDNMIDRHMYGNHDGYALEHVSNLTWWKDIDNRNKLIIHVSDGKPHCDDNVGGKRPCGLPGCASDTELQKHYANAVNNLVVARVNVCGLGVNRDMDQYFGKDNWIRTKEEPSVMFKDFMSLFSRKIKGRWEKKRPAPQPVEVKKEEPKQLKQAIRSLLRGMMPSSIGLAGLFR